MAKLSVVVPCYNIQRFLAQCVHSLLGQAFARGEVEIILVNDGSLDETLRIAQNLAREHPSVQIIDKANSGVGAARNAGLALATGEYVYFLDPDDAVAERTLPALVEFAISHELDVLSFDSKKIGEHDLSPPTSSDLTALSAVVQDGLNYLGTHTVPNTVWHYMVRLRFLVEQDLRFIEGRWMEDAILTAQIYCTASRVAHLNVDVHRYRHHPASAMRNRSSAHYRKLIFDMASAVETFDEIIQLVRARRPDAQTAFARLKARQESFVFFLLVRFMRSDLPIGQVHPMLERLRAFGAYPLNAFLESDYDRLAYRALVPVLNRPALIGPFFGLARVGLRALRW